MCLQTVLIALLGLSAVTTTEVAGKNQKTGGATDELAIQAKIADAVSPSLVRVEYTLKYDKGESPPRTLGTTIEQERPLEAEGFILSPTSVVAGDMKIHPRFIESIAVRYGDSVVDAEVEAWAIEQTAVFLKLSKPLTNAKPLAFNNEAAGPYYTVSYRRQQGLWTISVTAVAEKLTVRQDGRRFVFAPWYCLIVDGGGKPVGVSMNDELPLDGSWKGSPAKWATVGKEKMDGLLKKFQAVSDKGIVRVALGFRSPKKKPDQYPQYAGRDEQETERNVPGLLISPKQVLVLANLRPKVTARLNRVLVYSPVGDAGAGTTAPAEQKSEPKEAKFESTLTDYGCFLASLAEPVDGALSMSSGDPVNLRHKVLLSAEVRIQGDNRTAYQSHQRIYDYTVGWRGNLYPLASSEGGDCFLFDQECSLVALPVAHREKAPAERDRWSDRAILTAAAEIKKVLADLEANIDLSDVPLSEEEEVRLAWLGVELQQLDKELARANGVSGLSRDGEIGGLVSYVYPESPAAQAGVEVGHVLLRLHVAGYPKPLEVKADQYLGGRTFPWEQLDSVPEQYFERIPTPWPPAENAFTRALTDIGFGKQFDAEFFSNGQVVKKSFTVVQSPRHYDEAQKYKSEPLGLTVKDLTYEVRRYFNKEKGDPGVIVAKVEPGSKASVSGIKPYEIITEVNGQPVAGVGDFEKLIAGQEELRLSVKRMTTGRVVRMRLTTPASQPTTATTQAAVGN